MKRDEIREALAKMTPADRADLEAAVLSELARSGTPIKSTVETPNGPVEMFSRVVEAKVPADYEGPRVIRLRRNAGVGLAGLDLTEAEP
jgi:hypothetical protein